MKNLLLTAMGFFLLFSFNSCKKTYRVGCECYVTERCPYYANHVHTTIDYDLHDDKRDGILGEKSELQAGCNNYCKISFANFRHEYVDGNGCITLDSSVEVHGMP